MLAQIVEFIGMWPAGEASMNDRPFYVLLGPDGAGKSSVMAEVEHRLPTWRTLSTDDAFVRPEHGLVTRLRHDVVGEILPNLGTAYSADFMASLLQTAVIHLKDEIQRQDDDVPVVVDSYYYKILAKCRLAGVEENPMYAWWRSFPQPCAVVYMDVSPRSAWRRSGNGARLNALEYFGDLPEWLGFEDYQESLRKLMLEEIRELPVTIIEEQPSVACAADAVVAVLTS